MQKLRIGWIGCGVMGQAMCMNLRKAGYDITVYSRTKEKCADLASQGCRIGTSVREVGSESDVVFCMVGFPRDVEQVVLGAAGATTGSTSDSGSNSSDDGNCLMHSMPHGSIVVDMSTNSPRNAVSLCTQLLKTKNVYFLDAPVTGGDVGARNASLSIMCGGDREVYEKVLPLFECIGKTISYIGPVGMGQHTKMVNQILISTNIIGVVESLIYAYKTGLDLENCLRVVQSGSAGSWSLSNLGPRILDGDLKPGFYVEHFIKDLEIALDEARYMGLSLPGLALSHELFMSLKAQGHGKKGIHALILALENMNNIKITKKE